MKTCSICKQELPIEQFYITKREPSFKVSSYCKKCTSEYYRRYYKEEKDWLNKLKDKPCLDCNKKYPSYVMDFDHRPNEIKLFKIARATSTRKSREVIETEIAKCDLVCANCHRERTHQRSQGAVTQWTE